MNIRKFSVRSSTPITKMKDMLRYLLRKKCSYLELFWSGFFHIRTEYREILVISPYSVRMRENAYQNNSEYGHFLRND